MTPQQKAKEYAVEYAENQFPYDIGGDDSWNEKNALVEDVAETACLFMHEWDKEQFIEKACEYWEKELIFPSMSEVMKICGRVRINMFKKAMEECL